MNFTAALCIGCFLFCIGGALASIVCELSAKLFHRKYLKSRFVITCVLLSGAVVAATAALIYVPGLFMMFPLSKSDILFFTAVFFLGIGCSACWKIFLPFVLLCYIIISAFTGFYLYHSFGSPVEYHEISQMDGYVYVDDAQFAVSGKDQKSIVIKVYTLPYLLLLPLPRVWYRISGVTDADSESSGIESAKGGAPAVQSKETEGGAWRRMTKTYESWILSKYTYQYVRLPKTDILPVLYTMTCHSFGGHLYCTVSRSL